MEINVNMGNVLGYSKEAQITKIYKKEGDTVKVGDVIFDSEAGKGSASVKSEVEGKVVSIKVKAGDKVGADTVLAVVEGEKVETSPSKTKGEFNYFANILKPLKEEVEADITIIGGGPGGYVAAIEAAKMGAKVVVIEKDKVGGTCLNWGCIPTKTLVRSAEVYELLKRAEEFGCFAEDAGVDIKKVISRKDKVVEQLVQGIEYLLSKNGIRSINGNAKILDKNTIAVKEKMTDITINSKNIIIATGSVSSSLRIPGADLKNVMDSKGALSINNLPKKLVVIGGGVIGMEFAYIFADFGADVSVVEYFDECLINCDKDICSENAKNAAAKGIKLYTGAKVEEIIKAEGEECLVVFTQNGRKKYISTEKVLMAVGRAPHFEGLGVEDLGVELNANKRGIKVNSKMQTNIPNIYAIGDVTNVMQLAHVASHQGIVAVNNIMGEDCEMDYGVVPAAIFTQPEIAMVGVSEKSAEKEGLDIEVGKFPFSANGKVLAFGENSGFIKLIKDKETGRVIGGSIIGIHATDLIGEITLAVKNNLTAKQIVETIHAHPTTSEVIHEAALALEGGAIHFAQ
ncbi:dihydrolipoyl dehydrogenase [Clostridium sp. JN-1]|uniref:dihydrolipoyl dehydrogenase n=1 Tax=Clostridium sp. JN-1 TaxID=2483110 RepID=UPI0016805BAE|nr:dihydrolipoyl dehydrogenase [Clostridium sp. JN-1]